MKIKPFFPVFITLVAVVIYGYYTAEKRPEKGITATPKQYIEMVEKNQAEKSQLRGEGTANPVQN